MTEEIRNCKTCKHERKNIKLGCLHFNSCSRDPLGRGYNKMYNFNDKWEPKDDK